MFDVNYNPPRKLQRRQLLVLSVCLAAAACGIWYLAAAPIVACIVGLLSLVSFAGFVAFNLIGRDVYLLLMVLFGILGRLISWVIVLLMFVCAVTIPGLILRLFGMNQLDKDFQACRKKQSLFRDAPTSDSESFRRQS